ncbi:hypothetical protein ASE00_07430 [Sphingomonas sp. Root710]|uniref:hypothetical protein n=1 Tax=Sphingomonas sp. Root710 TaxID=1736594 RepID=UPI0006FFBAE6|nr:hypothetical protein [Sphingomonas sp. Root710]KRB86522.1 hypothetical protein ASE00_07430 [Sphingomonas sp. Root710]
MLDNVPGNVLNYAEMARGLKAELARANEETLDEIICLLARSGYDRPEILEILTDLMGSTRAATAWCDRNDLLGNDRWWNWLSDFEAGTEAPWLRWGKVTVH